MKRGGFIQRRTPLRKMGISPKRSPMRRVSKSPISKAKKRAWDAFSRFIRLRDRLPGTDLAGCVTCFHVYPIRGHGCIEAGHYMAGRRNSILYHEKNCHAQCHECNQHKGGNRRAYAEFMARTYGVEVVAEIAALGLTVVNMTAAEHTAIAVKYEAKVEALGGWRP